MRLFLLGCELLRMRRALVVSRQTRQIRLQVISHFLICSVYCQVERCNHKIRCDAVCQHLNWADDALRNVASLPRDWSPHRIASLRAAYYDGR